jgi:hypothetical protein
MFIVDFWLESTWGASLWNKDTWFYIEKNLHFYSSIALIGWILFLSFKFLMVVEEEIMDIEPYYHPISKLKVANDNDHPEIHKEIEKHEDKEIFYHDENNKQNAVERMIDETSFRKNDIDISEGESKNDENKALKSALSFKIDEPKKENKEIPDFLKKDAGVVKKDNVEKISSRKDTSTEKILKDKKFKSFELNSINQTPIEFFAVNNKDLFIGLKFENKNEILVNEKENINDIEPRFWFTKNSRVESPIAKLNSIRKSAESIISEVLPNTTKVNVNTIIILENTKISNVENAKKVFSRNKILATSNDISEKDFPLFEKALKYNKEDINKSFVEFIETLVKYFDQQEKLKAA